MVDNKSVDSVVEFPEKVSFNHGSKVRRLWNSNCLQSSILLEHVPHQSACYWQVSAEEEIKWMNESRAKRQQMVSSIKKGKLIPKTAKRREDSCKMQNCSLK